MGWYRCACGYMTEESPRLGASIASVYHLHRAARLDGGSSILRMEEVPDPALDCELACGMVGQEAHHALTATGTRSTYLPPAETEPPRRRAA